MPLSALRTNDRDLDSVEDPGDAKSNQDKNVKSAPGQAIQPRRNIGRDHPDDASCDPVTNHLSAPWDVGKLVSYHYSGLCVLPRSHPMPNAISVAV